MKKTHLSLMLYSFSISISAQVGIGSNIINDNIILQIESRPSPTSTKRGGLLIPNVSLTSKNSFLPLAGTQETGLLIYNTSNSGSGTNLVYPGLYFWNNTNSTWQRIEISKNGVTAQFSNQDTSTDINARNGIYSDIFANIRFNNDPSIYERINSTTLRINEAGYYKVTLNLDLASSGGADNFGIEILVNGQRDIVSENIYIPGRWDTEGGAETNFPNGRSYVLYIPINVPGQTINLITYEIDPSTDVRFKNANTSTISFQKIR